MIAFLNAMWGIIPAAGKGSRIQPLAFSKELLPVGSRIDRAGQEHPRAVSEYLIERMLLAGVDKFCFVISAGKSDILEYYGGRIESEAGSADVCYVVQSQPAGLCDALFHAHPLIAPDDSLIVGLPDTIWFPAGALARLPGDTLSFLLFPVRHPELFDAVLADDAGPREAAAVRAIQVKQPGAATCWIWGAFSLPGRVFHELHALWRQHNPRDEYLGTLVNSWLARGGRATAVRAGEIYVDVGTVNGYRQALQAIDRAGENAYDRTTHAGADPPAGAGARLLVP
ncbi:MAG TPA: sugar phosphate nucleotidyltransferase [Bryobacteraceae bacterium]|nr:sugar phosphate nucleotidyltransferase [Bryobacteraceae bacterium]